MKNGFNIQFFLPSFLGHMIAGLAYQIREALRSDKRYGFYWSRETSAYIINKNLDTACINAGSSGSSSEDNNTESPKPQIKKQKIQINWINVFGVLSRAIVMMMSHILHAAVLYTSTLAQINFSLIINLYSITPFINAISFYFFFKQTLNKIYLLGMIMIMTCIVLTGLSQG